ncbi:hypothetical protein AQUCO_06300018v1 [Aquilegia coerulea]|uniref:Uncharacterized protein n=1 Tax=Aquilegia coerulea TaxID=218851 RepID=A0A2G5CCQ8_AQUCA|nr:hypothetical protein AQUCO_06300018v1 [Aquilegia coerulea]
MKLRNIGEKTKDFDVILATPHWECSEQVFSSLCRVNDINVIVNDIETILDSGLAPTDWFPCVCEFKTDWFSCVCEFKRLVNDVQLLLRSGYIGCFSKDEVVDWLRHVCEFRIQVYLICNKIVSHRHLYNFPERSLLWDTIWGSLLDPKVGIYAVYGIGGVGKTTAMRKIRDQLAASDIFDKIFWVTLYKDISLDTLQTEIALQINLDLPMNADTQFRAAKILERLKKIKFLFIFDNVCKDFSLQQVGIPQPETENGCKIVLITRYQKICKNMNSDIIMELEPLSWEEGWKLFVSKVGSVVRLPEIQPYAKKMVRHCRGLPIGLVSIGHALRNEINVEVWREAFEYLHTEEDHAVKDYVFKLLKFSYHRLNNDNLQNCFLYCAFFPAGYLFKPEELVRYWMSETLINEAADIVAVIDEGYKVLRKLQDANMLQMFTEGGEVFVKMHDLLRGLAIAIIKMKPGFSIQAGIGLWDQPQHFSWAGTRKISLMRNSIPRLNVVPDNCPQISTLLLSDNPISYIISRFFSQMITLEFLDLSYTLIKELPTSLSELTQLRALFLHYCTRLNNIPCLNRLKNLQSLSLCGTAITELPQGMEGLASLRSLDLSETTKLESIRVGLLSSLSRLEELRLHRSGLCKMDSPIVANYLMEMRSLKHLSILTLSVVGYGDHLDTIMCLQGHLKIFSVNVYGSTDDYIEDVETV